MVDLDSDVTTPVGVVDADVLERNIDGMAALARDRGLVLRPHAKTHKMLEVARRQLDAGAVGLTVATLAEAEVFAAAGVEDLFVAYPLWLDREKGRRLRELLDWCPRLRVGADSPEAIRTLAAQLRGDAGRLGVLVEVDSGHHRSGVEPREAGPLAEIAAHSGLRVDGVFTFPGHGYSPDVRTAAATEEATALARAAASLTEHGVAAEVRSGGSSPTAALATADALTEIRPGVYVFGDAQQLELGATSWDRVAYTVWATVVSHAAGNVVLDAGSKVIGADRAGWATGHGRLLDHPEARIRQLSEHHAVVAWDHSPRPAIGSRVRVVPNHVCTAVNLVDEVLVTRAGALVDSWRVAARGRNA